MRIVLGGYLETALVHYSDAINRPDRNRTWHEYYVCLNRRVPKPFFDRAATFVALARQTLIPSIDWALQNDGQSLDGVTSDQLAVSINEPFGGGEWDDDTVAFVNILIDNDALSLESWVHASRCDRQRVNPEPEATFEERYQKLRRSVGHHYLCRLLLQTRAAVEAEALLAITEPDIVLLREIGAFLLRTRLPAPYAIPDLTQRLIDADDFAAGLINFSPPDALALAAVRQDDTVRRYSAKVAAVMGDINTIDAQRELLRAMRDAHARTQREKRFEKAFEIGGWVVKPLHYVPIVGEALTLAEDVKDVAAAWLHRDVDRREWYLLASRMTDVAIDDYLSRKDNFLA